jgi:DNA polymerase sigma
VEICPWGKVPVLKIFNHRGIRELNVIFGHKLGLFNSHLIRWYANDDLTLYWVGMQVKRWAKENGLVNKPENHNSYISAYSWILMVIFFFQVCVRSTHSIQLASQRTKVKVWGFGSSVEVESCNGVITDADCDAATASEGVRTLNEFFIFYGYTFNWQKMTVDIKNPENGLINRCFDSGTNGDEFLAIRDPYERDRNLGRGLNKKSFDHIIKMLRREALE